GRRTPGYDFFLKIVPRKEQYRARNNLVNMAMGVNADWILFLDDDMVVPDDLFARLVAHDKDVCGALYFQRGGQYFPVMMKRTEAKDGYVNYSFIEDFPRNSLFKVDVIGGGCMLIKMSVFERMMEPYFWIDGIGGTDVYFSHRCYEMGVEIFCDTGLELGHMTTGEILTERTLPAQKRFMGAMHEKLIEDAMGYTGLGKDRIYDACIKASGFDHGAFWLSRERESWEGYLDFYTNDPEEQLLRLIYFQLETPNVNDLIFNRVDPFLLKRLLPGNNILDFGAGTGRFTVALAEMGFDVRSVDLISSPYQEFVKWRVKERELNVDFGQILDFAEWTPNVFNGSDQYHGVLMVGVFDHLPNPLEVVKHIHASMAPTAVLVMDVDTGKGADHNNPQHLLAFDSATIQKEIEKIGFKRDHTNQFVWERL
ncbi:hypothetical protein LCGC14_2163720, partial [marine sediment metagenome]